MELKNVLILMASYNGEKFISEQIESIINQSYKNWKLLIRDDGSEDSTLKVINKYCLMDNRIELISSSSKYKKHGAYPNFYELLNHAKKLEKYDFYLFCDQDDIWETNKIISLVNFIESKNKNDVPILAYSDMSVINECGEIIYDSLNSIMGTEIKVPLAIFFTHAYVWGCSVIINRALFELVPVYPLDNDEVLIMSHDNYYAKFAAIYGEILFCNQQLVKYRRHGENVTSSNIFKLDPIIILKKMFFQLPELVKTHARVYNQSIFAIKMMRLHCPMNNKTDKIYDVLISGGNKAVEYCIKAGIKRNQFSRTVGIYLILLSGFYKKYLIANKLKNE